MIDIIGLVTGYYTIKKLKQKGFLKEDDLNISFAEFIMRSIKAIKEIEKEEVIK